MTKAEARTAARQRAAEERAAAAKRRRRNRLIGIGGGILGVLVVVGVVVAIVLASVASGSASAAGRTSPPPWPVPSDTEARVHDAGLEMLSAEGTALHIHQHLSVTVDGKAVTVPALIGIEVVNGQETALSAIHTHDTTGIIHVESPVKKTFTLRQVFAEWDVLLAKGRIGSYRAGHDGVRIGVYVNQKPYTGNPGSIVLTSHEDIDFVVTTNGTAPAAPTKAYTFPSGY